MFSLLQPFLLRHSGRVLFNAARKAPIIYRTAPSLSSISSRKLVARQYSKEKGNDDNGENHTADSESAGSQEPSDPVPSSSRLSPSSALVLPETKLPTYAPMLAYHRIYMPGTATPFDPYAQMKDGEYIALFLSKKNPIYPITSLLTEQKKKEDAKAKKKTKQAADRDSEPPKVLVEGSQHEIPENIFEVHAVEERPIVEDTTEDISTQSDAKEIDTRHEQKDLDATTNTSANITTTDATSTDTTVTEATATDATSTDTTPTDITTNATATDTISTDATTTTSTTATETTIEVINSTLSDTTEIVPSDTTATHSTTSATTTDTAATETNETYATKVSSTSTETKPASSAATSTSVDKSTQQGDGKDHAGGPSPSTTSTPVGLIAKKQAESGGAVVDSTAVYDVGVLAVVDKQSVANPRLRFLLPVKLCGTARPNLGVSIAPHKSDPFDSQEVEELMGKVKAALTKAMQAFPSTLKVNTSESLMKQKDPNRFVFGLMAEYPSYLAEAQAVLSATSVPYRLAIAQAVVETDMAIRQKQQEINKTLDERTTKEQREFFLREQLKMVRKELGERDEKEELIEKYRARLTGEVPKEAMKVIDDELAKLQMLEPSSSEYSITRNYLDWLTILPWGIYSKDSYDLKHAREVLEADHYGLKDIKERILEFIAVGNLKGSVQGKIICLVGPPGVGKTSIGKSIAGALGRKFYRFSVGGMGDVSEIKGHRRTYVGAMPGKLLQCLKQVKVANPVILIDEIDKLGRGRQGDPASALLEVLDPEQNATFMDHYLDVPVDLSKVLFICTANVKDAIPKPLLDRMEVMYLSGYIPEEQVQIVKKYLVPTAVKSAGLKPGQVEIEDSAVQLLVRAYCREAGVRNLQKHVEKIARKVALKRVRGTRKVSTITETNLSFYVGKPIFSSDRYYQQTPPGIVMGLAWTQLGGAALYVETVQDPLLTRPEMRITGQLGDVMKESTSIAYTYAKNHLDLVDSGNRFFEGASLHMHIPEGATPKDGPSAGITMVTSLLSLALSQPVLQNLAMTGELTLTGKVLPIGGVREKCIASKRAGVTRIILPVGNKKDWTDLPVNIKKGLTVYFADYYKDVYEIAFASPTNIPAPDQTLQYDPKAKSTSSSSPKKSSQKTSISSSNRKSVTSPHKSARLPTSRATAIPSKSYTTILHITKHSSKQLHNMKSAPLLKRAAISKVGQRKKTILKSAPPTKKPPQSPTRKK